MRCVEVRVLVFAGDVSGADAAVRAAIAGARSPIDRAFATACAAVVDGTSDRRALAQQRCAELLASGIAPDSVVASGIYVLAAYAVITIGDVPTTVRLILAAGGDADLGHLRIIDRAICFEVLVHAAVDDHDLDAAQSWLQRCDPLAGHPIVDSTIGRIRSRVALLAGDAQAALDHALLSVEHAHRHRRGIEAAEGEVLAARARIALRQTGEASRRLAEVVAEANERGHRAVRLSAARELRPTGRRLPPEPSGWDGLSAREREVAGLMVADRSNAEIAAELFLSE
ncbi:MAG: response regulator transcription factor, partial [Microbacteriaceae bacterium]|nr:response regulator transcription factor [Microbacteriaceae bacterium]